MAGDTGFSAPDAQSDFTRARRRQQLRRLAVRLRREPDDIDQILPFGEVLEALGRTGERYLGVSTIEVGTIVGTVDRGRGFDRSFRPTSHRVRRRWERIALAMRRGEALPPISVFRVGDIHFVEDGHHRVSVARQMGMDRIEARVTEVLTAVSADELHVADLPLKSHERLFFERVPLPPEHRSRIQLKEGAMFAQLAESVESWGFRAMQAHGRFMSRSEVAELWFAEEYEPVVEMLKEGGLLGDGTETEAVMVISDLRYTLLRTHTWDEGVITQVREAIESGELRR